MIQIRHRQTGQVLYRRGAKSLADSDLSGKVLMFADLAAADLRGADLRGADLSNADLRGARLDSAQLVRSEWSGADARGASLVNADVTDACLLAVNFDGADLSGSTLVHATVTRAKFGGAKLAETGCPRRFAPADRPRPHDADRFSRPRAELRRCGARSCPPDRGASKCAASCRAGSAAPSPRTHIPKRKRSRSRGAGAPVPLRGDRARDRRSLRAGGTSPRR